MSLAHEYYYGDPAAQGVPTASAASVRRSLLVPLLMLPPTILSGVSYLSGGNAGMTDLAMIMLTVVCLVGVVGELRNFSARMGLGGIVIYTGVIVWYLYDYFHRWSGSDGGVFGASAMLVDTEVIAKGALVVCLFTLFASLGLMLPPGRRPMAVIRWIPEPATDSFFFVLVIGLSAFAVIPFFLFTAEPFYISIYKAMTAMRSGDGTQWTVGRTGNLNYSFGGYIAQWLDVGAFAGILAGCYALTLARGLARKLLCWGIFLFWASLGFGTGSRGMLLYHIIPVVAVVFVKYHVIAGRLLKKVSVKAYAWSAVLLFLSLVAVQFQGAFRNTSVEERDLAQMDIMAAQGNTQFSEMLPALGMVPTSIPHPAVNFPGAGFIRPIPDVVIRFAIGWIPRVIWTNKPGIGDFNAMYNEMISGGTAVNTSGGTVAISVAGAAYVFYGWPGVMQIALLFGWLCSVAENIVKAAGSSMLILMFGLGCCAYLFRAFRDLTPHDFYPLAIGVVVASFVVYVFGPMFGAAPVVRTRQ